MVSLPIRRNTLILAATLAVNSAVLQLVAAVSSLTFVLVTRRTRTARARTGDLSHGLRAYVSSGRPDDGSVRPDPRDLGWFRARRSGLRHHRSRDTYRLDAARHPRLRRDRRRQCDRFAHPHCGRRYVPARPPRARDLVRPVRVGVRRDSRPDGVRPALRRQGRRGRRADGAMARRRRHQLDRARPRAVRPSGSEGDRRGDRSRGCGRGRRAATCRTGRSAAERSCDGRASCPQCWPRSPVSE